MNRILYVLNFLLLSVVLLSCWNNKKKLNLNGSVITPIANASEFDSKQGNVSSSTEESAVLPLVNLGEDYNILSILDRELGSEQLDEQVIVAIPITDQEASLKLMIASTNTVRNQYDIVWSASLKTRTLVGITLRAADLIQGARRALIVSGFDEQGNHVMEIFAAQRNASITDYRKIFGLSADGNIDMLEKKSNPSQTDNTTETTLPSIIVQEHDPSSNNSLDLVETRWEWNPRNFIYRAGASQKIRAESILGNRIRKVYTGDVSEYENYLRGAWYRESGPQSNSQSFDDMLYFNPDTRRIMIYDDSAQEILRWGTSHRTTAKRLYSKVTNDVINSLSDRIWVSAESWDLIEISRSGTAWSGNYRRLDESLQQIVNTKNSLSALEKETSFTGVWQSRNGESIVFNFPRIEWTSSNKTKSGTVVLFSLNKDVKILEVQFITESGIIKETSSWKVELEEDSNENRTVRSLTLTPVSLNVDGVKSIPGELKRFEQIEVISSAN